VNLRSNCKSILWVLCAVACCAGQLSRAQTAQPAAGTNEAGANRAKPSNAQRAKLGAEALQQWYDPKTGTYKTTGWWNAANAITVLADYAKATHSTEYDYVFSNTLSVAQKQFPGFINEYYDDEGWWALAWINVYQHTQDARYLEAAEFIFKDMSYGWSDTCSGGIWWSKARKYKNAIANELFLSVAAELATEARTEPERSSYRGWARREWTWFQHSGMTNKSHLVNDGLNENCENNGRTTWTYNQGVLLGGLSAFSKFDHSPAVLRAARETAQAAVSMLADSGGVLRESCEPHCGADGTQFKGIFMRNLRQLEDADQKSSQYQDFFAKNADSIWSQTSGSPYRLGQIWASPFGEADASTQSSALDALVAAIPAQASH
jgi:predicted alpha-1,6-mannanase (GH76 family)